jgi:hypothetical protein
LAIPGHTKQPRSATRRKEVAEKGPSERRGIGEKIYGKFSTRKQKQKRGQVTMKKRIGLLLTLAAVMAAVLALSAAGASAEPQCTVTNDRGQFTQECVETVVTTRTETVAAEQPCEVGSSGRTGVQSGTLTRTIEVTTTTTTTTVFQGNPRAGNIVSGPESDVQTTERVLSEDFSATGPCKNVPGPQ